MPCYAAEVEVGVGGLQVGLRMKVGFRVWVWNGRVDGEVLLFVA